MEEQKIIRVLSIDFDYIMAPCLNLYNHLAHGDENPTVNWLFIEQELNIENHLQYDAKYLQAIVDIIIYQMRNGASFTAIESHEEIVTKLKDLPDYKDVKFDVTNIDFHHDLIYDCENVNRMVDFDEYNCANWFGYLYLKDKINHGTWFKASNSPPPDYEKIKDFFADEEICEVKPSFMLHSLWEEDKYDMIFLCKSPQWVPHQYEHLYNIVKAIGEAVTLV